MLELERVKKMTSWQQLSCVQNPLTERIKVSSAISLDSGNY